MGDINNMKNDELKVLVQELTGTLEAVRGEYDDFMNHAYTQSQVDDIISHYSEEIRQLQDKLDNLMPEGVPPTWDGL